MTAEYNIVLAGRVGVGKSALFRRLRKNDFEETCASETLTRYEGGSERWVYRTEVGGEPVKVRAEGEREGKRERERERWMDG